MGVNGKPVLVPSPPEATVAVPMLTMADYHLLSNCQRKKWKKRVPAGKIMQGKVRGMVVTAMGNWSEDGGWRRADKAGCRCGKEKGVLNGSKRRMQRDRQSWFMLAKEYPNPEYPTK